MSIRSWIASLFAEPTLDTTKPDPMPYLAADGCRFPRSEVRDGHLEHGGLDYAPRWRTE